MSYTGRVQRQDITVEEINATQTGTVAASALETYVLTPPANEIWEILSWRLDVAPPAGAGSGAHILQVQSTNLAANALVYFYVSKAFGSYVDIDYNEGFDKPADAVVQMMTMRSLIITNTDTIELKYSNNTNVDQNNNRVYLLLVKKMKVV